MRYNTPIATSFSSSASSRKAVDNSLSPFSVSSASKTSSPSKLSAIDMKETTKTTTAMRAVHPKYNADATNNFSAPLAKVTQRLAFEPTKSKKEHVTVHKGTNILDESNNKSERQTMAIAKKAQQLQEVAEKTVVTENRKKFERGSVKNEAKDESLANIYDEPQVVHETELGGAILVEAEAEVELEEAMNTVEVEALEELKKKDLVAEIVLTDRFASMDLKEGDVDSEKMSFQEAKAVLDIEDSKLNSVQLRKQKLEEMEREARRRASNPYGLLKRPHSGLGLPSDAWNRVNLPPKKAVSELP